MKTQKTSAKETKYKKFGDLLARLRLAARIERQADLADMLKATQQTVSRWEAGLSRPRENQIPQIASAIGVAPEQLMEAAGYSVPTVVASFDKPFPVDALTPDSFERLCAYLLQRMSPDVLADYVTEAACVGAGRQSTGYAEAAFDLAGDRLAENLLLNLGKLDWRLSNGDASNSDLLNGV